ncbi:MAG TPA: DNA recombination protein RmuC, partial [Geobacteraceae bacterium]|nr:DNA recombination protein RmuC [Geobacteraceae bacterium]
MEYLFLAIGAVLGGLCVWFLLRSREHLAFQKGRGEMEASVAALTERLQGKELQIADLRGLMEKADAETVDLRSQLKTESDRRSAAEEKNRRIPELESAVEARETRLRAQSDE